MSRLRLGLFPRFCLTLLLAMPLTRALAEDGAPPPAAAPTLQAAPAANPVPVTTAPSAPTMVLGSASPLGAGSLLQALLGLILVLALLMAAAYWLRKVQGQRGLGGGLMRVVAALPLGTRERLVIVEVADTWLVLGITPQGIVALHTLPKGEAPPAPELLPPFAAKLKEFVDRRHGQPRS